MPFVRQLMQRAEAYTRNALYAPRDLSSLLWVVARLQLNGEAEGQALLLALVPSLHAALLLTGGHKSSGPAGNSHSSSTQQQQQPCNAQDISMCAWSLARMGVSLQLSESATPPHPSPTAPPDISLPISSSLPKVASFSPATPGFSASPPLMDAEPPDSDTGEWPLEITAHHPQCTVWGLNGLNVHSLLS